MAYDFLPSPNRLDRKTAEYLNPTSKMPEHPANSAVSDAREQFLQLYLLQDTIALLPITRLAEVLTISATQIIPIPHMPPWMMGVCNWRGEILSLVDLGHLVGFAPVYQKASSASNYTLVVLQNHAFDPVRKSTDKQIVGLIVERVGNIEWCDPNLIQTLSSTGTSELGKFLRGYYSNFNDEKILAVFDLDAIWTAISQPY